MYFFFQFGTAIPTFFNIIFILGFFMCFVESETRNFILKFRENFPTERNSAHGPWNEV